MVSALDFQAGYRRFESCSGRDNFQTISTPSSYSTCPGLSIKWTGQRLVTDSGTKCAWVIHESKAVQIHVHNNRRCLYVPRVLVALKICTTTTTTNNRIVYTADWYWIFSYIRLVLSIHLYSRLALTIVYTAAWHFVHFSFTGSPHEGSTVPAFLNGHTWTAI